MQQFWREHSRNPSLQDMMLDSNAQLLSQEERPEILELLPLLDGQDVLELGAGIGRYTSVLAEPARHVTAVDFMESFVEQNRRENGHRDNVAFLQGDVTCLQLPGQSFHLIFSNWLFMYLADEELRALARRMLSWLRPGGHLFFRESCFHQSGDSPRSFNPTLYRTPAQYNQLLTGAQETLEEKNWGFEIVFSRSVQTYVKRKGNRNQVCWLLQKGQRIQTGPRGCTTFQQFLDSGQYTERSIRRYEWLFGTGFVSTGGLATTKVPGQGDSGDRRSMDVGQPEGEFGVKVLGMDLSHNMVELALERAQQEDNDLVEFEVGDVTRRSFPAGSFQVLYSRDTLLHIADKGALFRKFLAWLKPGGQLLISDYCCGPRPWSEAFTVYVRQRGYTLLTPQEYGQALQEAGFTQVQAWDRTKRMALALSEELQELERNRQDFIQAFSEVEFDSMACGWREKQARCLDGDQRWGVLYAKKPQ
uniref:phosphoethanolamine N-methyltransferase n=1 Tax=Sphenodon punctatus TaxID=8508 RepID=A0A8D0GTA4_SPHPU